VKPKLTRFVCAPKLIFAYLTGLRWV